ncbi:MAG: hypothetical protein UW63_C0094G0004 [Candidatus Uhrbacteria bacterium GW2011_GWF2_44_350]|uniref:Uncharacterized protein n=1 Tax=Candidatus Uhrbacteria bacterium GW2011_GWF2_44_350 TaxID=1619000 RepID=A0A0G1J948_9BACT|nr:MAG: hypothetical protein UW63_C0094G0004 [Candidatus Uhrbacteria bacterium GW2011_GWF2_44_350]HBR80690.1 hypothetical protein [Candidatus Uhrbacteria bacterium]HCU31642.1 hypothetical protein [Candidatus Uhrbacteria bacterium]
MSNEYPDSPLPPWLRPKEIKNPAEFLCTPEILERAQKIGVSEPEKVLKALINTLTARPQRFEQPKPQYAKNIDDLIKTLEEYLQQISFGQVNYYFGAFQNISLMITIVLPQLSKKPEFRKFLSDFFDVYNQKKGRDKIGRMLGREFGLHFKEFEPLIETETAEYLRQELLEEFPLGIVPALDEAEINDKTQEKFRLDEAAEIENTELISSPYGLSLSEKFIDVLTPGVCPWTEVYYSDGLAKNDAPILSFNGKIFGIQDPATGTVLIVRSMKQAGRTVLLRGGIYDLTIAKDDPNDYSPDASGKIDFGQASILRFIPLRLWVDNQLEPSSGVPLKHDSLEEIIRKVLEKN